MKINKEGNVKKREREKRNFLYLVMNITKIWIKVTVTNCWSYLFYFKFRDHSPGFILSFKPANFYQSVNRIKVVECPFLPRSTFANFILSFPLSLVFKYVYFSSLIFYRFIDRSIVSTSSFTFHISLTFFLNCTNPLWTPPSNDWNAFLIWGWVVLETQRLAKIRRYYTKVVKRKKNVIGLISNKEK